MDQGAYQGGWIRVSAAAGRFEHKELDNWRITYLLACLFVCLLHIYLYTYAFCLEISLFTTYGFVSLIGKKNPNGGGNLLTYLLVLVGNIVIYLLTALFP